MTFIIEGLSADNFQHLYGKSDEELQQHSAIRYVCTAKNSFPDRIEMRDLEIGETALLVNYTSMDKQTPYKASHAIYVKEGAEQSYSAKNEIPVVMSSRLLSLRAFDQAGMIVDAGLATGEEIKPAVETLLDNPEVAHIDAHFAARGCFAGRITRA